MPKILPNWVLEVQLLGVKLDVEQAEKYIKSRVPQSNQYAHAIIHHGQQCICASPSLASHSC